MPSRIRKEVIESVGIPSYTSIISELDRPNLYYNILISDMSSKYPGEGNIPLDFIMDKVRCTKDPKDIIKTIIYFDGVGQLKLYVKRLRSLLPTKLQHLASRIIQPYFANRADEDKNKIRADFLAGICCIICATEAFGMGMNIKDIIWIFQVNPPRNLPCLMQRFGRAAREESLNAICTLVLSKAWRSVSGNENHQPTNQTQRNLKLGNRTEVYTWITAPCLRRAFLDFLAVPEQYVIPPLGKCCSRCSETQRKSDSTLSTAVVGYEGICDMELEKARSEATKAARNEPRKWKTPEKLENMALGALEQWRNRNLDKQDWNRLFVPEMLVPDGILAKVARSTRRIACEPVLVEQIVRWNSYKKYRLDNMEDTVEDVIAKVWESMKDEIEQDELNAKETKKRKAAETRAKNKARKDSEGRSSDARPRPRGRPRKTSWESTSSELPGNPSDLQISPVHQRQSSSTATVVRGAAGPRNQLQAAAGSNNDD